MPPCGEILKSPFGRLTSFDYPNDYPNGLQCTWSIQRPEEDRIYIYFSDFKLAPGDTGDYVKV